MTTYLILGLFIAAVGWLGININRQNPQRHIARGEKK